MPVRYSAQSGRWTNPSTWQGGTVPQAGDQVVIQSGHTVTYDVVEGSSYDVELGTSGSSLDIDIYGTLRFDTSATQNLRLRFKGYVYVRDGGRFECGTDANPMPPVMVTIQKTVAGYHMFVVTNNGQVSLSGSPNLPPDGQGGYKIYTTLAAPASSGSSTIVVAEDLNWQVGDYIYMPRAVEVTSSSVAPFGATVNAVTQNQDGTYTLTLSTTLPQNYIAGTHIAKANRLIRIIDPNTSTSYYTFQRAASYVPITSLKWVEFNRAGTSYGIFVVPYFTAPYYAEYLSTTPAGVWSGFALYYVAGSPVVFRRCVGMLVGTGGGHNNYFSECVGGGYWSLTSYSTIYADNCILFNPYIAGNASQQALITNSICYSVYFGGGVSIDFVNCVFYGVGYMQNFNVPSAHIVKFKSCIFKYGCDGTSRPRFDWGVYNTAQRWLEVIDCQFYNTWVEPSTFSNSAYFPEHRGSHPLPFVRFINKQTTSGIIAEQIFRSGGIVTSVNNDVPTPTVPYAYLFEPKNASFPLVYDVEQASGQSYRVWIKAGSGSPTVKLQVIRKAEAVLLPTLVTPINELTLTPPAAWTAYLVTVPSDCILRIAVQGSSGSVKMAWERIDRVAPEKTLTENLKTQVADMVAKALYETLPQGY